MNLEICVDNITSAINASEGGADRIELCAALDVGGLTPTYSFAKEVKSKVTIPVFALIRCRNGDFNYTDIEKDIMMNEIRQLKTVGIDGFVIGALNSTNILDDQFLLSMISEIGGLPITFHRAIDVSRNPEGIIEFCIQHQIKRILTSGSSVTAEAGLEQLKSYHQHFGDRVSIMPGSGINFNNINAFKTHGFRDIHMSLRKSEIENSHLFGKQRVVDKNDIKEMKQILNNE